MEELNFQPELVELRCIKFIGGKGWGEGCMRIFEEYYFFTC